MAIVTIYGHMHSILFKYDFIFSHGVPLIGFGYKFDLCDFMIYISCGETDDVEVVAVWPYIYITIIKLCNT